MEKIADLLTKFMISESSSENLDYEVCKFGLLIQRLKQKMEEFCKRSIGGTLVDLPIFLDN